MAARQSSPAEAEATERKKHLRERCGQCRAQGRRTHSQEVRQAVRVAWP